MGFSNNLVRPLPHLSPNHSQFFALAENLTLLALPDSLVGPAGPVNTWGLYPHNLTAQQGLVIAETDNSPWEGFHLSE